MKAPRRALLPAVAAAMIVLVGCAAGSGTGTVSGAAPSESSDAAAGIRLPPVGAVPDYQLGEPYPPASEVGVVTRDRTADPAAETYSICYLNAFQTQPGELEQWPDDLLVHHDGAPLIDPAWPDEVLLDTSTADRRERIAEVITGWIQGCADAGFDAVEFDNLDSYTRSRGLLDVQDNLALARTLVTAAHVHGLAAAQKNAAEDAALLRAEAEFDFIVTEECAAYDECDVYAEVYGEHVIDIEYVDNLPRPFAEMCADPSAPASMVLRDRELLTAAHDGHVFTVCPG